MSSGLVMSSFGIHIISLSSNGIVTPQAFDMSYCGCFLENSSGLHTSSFTVVSQSQWWKLIALIYVIIIVKVISDMLQFDIELKCGKPAVRRLVWLKNTIYKLVFHIVDADGTPLDTQASWKGRIAEAWIGDNKIFWTSNPANLNTQQFIVDNTVVDMKFGGDSWTLQLIASDQPMQIVPSQGELPNNISCDILSARHQIECDGYIYAPRVQANQLQVFEDGDVARPGWLEVPNIDVKQIFIDEGLKNTGLTILRGTTEIDQGEVTTCTMPTIIDMRGARIVVDANTRVYCPISPKDGGEVYYEFATTLSEDLGYVLALRRVVDRI